MKIAFILRDIQDWGEGNNKICIVQEFNEYCHGFGNWYEI